MANTVTGIVYRSIKGSPLLPSEIDGNFSILSTFSNALSTLIGITLTPTGALVSGAISALSQFTNLPALADGFAANESLVTATLTASNFSLTNASITALVTGMRVTFKAGSACVANATLTINSLAAVPIVKSVSTNVGANDFIINQAVEVVYDGTNFQLFSARTVSAAILDVTTGTDNVKPVTSLTLANSLYTSTPSTFTAGTSAQSASHGFANSGGGIVPSYVRCVIVNQSTDAGYAAGDEVDASCVYSYGNFNGQGAVALPAFTVGANATSVFVAYSIDTATGTNSLFNVFNKSTGAFTAIDASKWKIKFYARP